METLKIPFKVKPGDNFQIKFVEKGKISPPHADYFRPPLRSDEIPAGTVVTHETLKKGEVNITFTPSGTAAVSTHTILIGD
jgi:hypothetical protein